MSRPLSFPLGIQGLALQVARAARASGKRAVRKPYARHFPGGAAGGRASPLLSHESPQHRVRPPANIGLVRHAAAERRLRGRNVRRDAVPNLPQLGRRCGGVKAFPSEPELPAGRELPLQPLQLHPSHRFGERHRSAASTRCQRPSETSHHTPSSRIVCSGWCSLAGEAPGD